MLDEASLFDTIAEFFTDELQVQLKPEWCSDFLAYISSSELGDVELIRVAYDQWRFSNLSESTQPNFSYFPGFDSVGLSGVKNEFPSRAVFQVESVLDVGVSFMSQFKKLTFKESDNSEFQNDSNGNEEEAIFDKAKPNRMLYLTLSDGRSQVNALEYEPIDELSILTHPGCKLMIIGPVQFRKNTFLLTPENIQILGGEVEELMVTNRLLHLLAKKLNKTIPGCEKELRKEKTNFDRSISYEMIAKPVKKFPLFKPLDTGLPSVFNAPELVYPSIYNEPKPRRPSVFKEPEPTRPSFLKAPESNRISVFKEPEPQLPSIFKEPEPVCPQTPSLASVHDISVVPETPLQDISVVPETPATIINRRGREQEFPTPGTFSYKGPMDFFVNRHKTRPVNYEENIKESLAKLIKEKRQQEEEESEEPVFKVPRLLPNRVVQSKTATNIPTAVVPPLPTQPKPSTFDLAHQKPVAKPTRDLILSQANSPSRPIKHFAPQPKPARRPADNFNRTISTVLAADYAFAEEPMLFQKTSKVLSTTSPLYEPQKIESLAKPPHERFLMNRSMPPQLDDLPRQDPTNWETSVSPENRITSVLHELQPSRFESALQDLKKEYQIVNSNRPSQLSLADRLKQLAYKSIPYHNTSSGNF